MRLQQSVRPSLAAYKRALAQKLGLKGKQLECAARAAQRGASPKQILVAAAWLI